MARSSVFEAIFGRRSDGRRRLNENYEGGIYVHYEHPGGEYKIVSPTTEQGLRELARRIDPRNLPEAWNRRFENKFDMGDDCFFVTFAQKPHSPLSVTITDRGRFFIPKADSSLDLIPAGQPRSFDFSEIPEGLSETVKDIIGICYDNIGQAVKVWREGTSVSSDNRARSLKDSVREMGAWEIIDALEIATYEDRRTIVSVLDPGDIVMKVNALPVEQRLDAAYEFYRHAVLRAFPGIDLRGYDHDSPLVISLPSAKFDGVTFSNFGAGAVERGEITKDYSGSSFVGCEMSGPHPYGYSWGRSRINLNLSNCDFTDVIMRNVDFTAYKSVNFTGADFTGADVAGCKFPAGWESQVIALPDVLPGSAPSIVDYDEMGDEMSLDPKGRLRRPSGASYRHR